MARRTSSSTQALLGLLTIEPMSGYDLGRLVRASIGHIWSESYGQIYPNLKKLLAQRLVECKTEKHKGRPDRRIYSITPKGREQLQQWLAIPPQPEIPRNEMLLKLFFGAQAPTQILIRNVESMVETHGALLQLLERTEHDGNRQEPAVSRRALLEDGRPLRPDRNEGPLAMGGRNPSRTAPPCQSAARTCQGPHKENPC